MEPCPQLLRYTVNVPVSSYLSLELAGLLFVHGSTKLLELMWTILVHQADLCVLLSGSNFPASEWRQGS